MSYRLLLVNLKRFRVLFETSGSKLFNITIGVMSKLKICKTLAPHKDHCSLVNWALEQAIKANKTSNLSILKV